MSSYEVLKSSKKEAENTPQEVIRAELNKELEPEVRKIYKIAQKTPYIQCRGMNALSFFVLDGQKRTF